MALSGVICGMVVNLSNKLSPVAFGSLGRYQSRPLAKNLATKQGPQTVVFNKKLRILHLDKASCDKDAHIYDYIKDHVAKDVCDRVEDLTSNGTKRTVLNIGSCSGLVAKNLNPNRVDLLIQGDTSRHSLERARRTNSMLPPKFPTQYLEFDEEDIPLCGDTFDIVISCLNYHGVNDLVKSFKHVHNVLRDDRCFIGAIFGGDTLYELRSSLQLAEMERLSGFSSHIAPKTTGQDIATLLQSSGFQLITVDISDVKINYPSMFELMFDLQGMGESNCSLFGSTHMHRNVMEAAASIYQTLYGDKNHDKGVPATFQVIHFIGWKNPTKATPLKSK